ncbi:Wzt carbohydrate-binding domain-containing protein, partial [Paenibacillus sp. MAH-36]
ETDIPMQEETKDSDINKYEKLRYGTGDIRIKKVSMLNEQGSEADHFEFGEIMSIAIDLHAHKQINNLNCCIRIRDKNGIDVTGTTTFEESIVFPTIKEREKLKVIFKAPNLLKHDMTFSVGVTINDTKDTADIVILDHVDLAYTFKSVYNPKRPVWYMYYQNYDIKFDIFK